MGLACVVYWPCFQGPLLWDDKDWLGAMEWNLRGWKGLWRLWTVPESLQQYYPVTAMSFWLDHAWWGEWTLPMHVENVLLHGASAGMFWWLLRRLGVPGAWWAAALFAVHPVMVESVAWITERKNVLSTFFGLLALLAHGAGTGWWESRWSKRPWLAGGWAFVFFGLALLSKIGAVVLPGAVMVIGIWRAGRVRWREEGLRMLLWVVVALPLVLVTSRLERLQVEGGDWLPTLTWGERLVLSGQLPWFYLGKLLWPTSLCVLYEKWELTVWQGAVGLLLAAGVVGLAAWRWRGALALVLLFLGALVPVLGFFDLNGMKYAWAADRWVYLPAMAVFTGIGIVLARWPRVVGALLVLVCGVLTWRQAGLYGSAEGFWQAAMAGSARPWKAHNDYGSHLLDSGRVEEARAQFEAALKLQPELVSAMVNLASALKASGRGEEALEWLERAEALHPEKGAAIHYTRAQVLESLNRTSEAAVAYEAALVQQPLFFAARSGLGNLHLLNGEWEAARRQFEQLLELRPGDAGALAALGNGLLMEGQAARALDCFQQALEDDPDLTSALLSAAWIQATSQDASLRDVGVALRRAERAVELTHREDPSALQVLAAAQSAAGQKPAALATLEQALSRAKALQETALAASLEAMRREIEARDP